MPADRAAMDDVAETELVEQAREAASSGDWTRAYGLLVRADERTRLTVDDLGLLAEVAYAAGHLEVTIEAWNARTRRQCAPATHSRRLGQRLESPCTS